MQRCRTALLLLLLLPPARGWKPDKQPSNEACAPWCVYDNGQGRHVDACLDAFKKQQCGGCERCKAMREAEALASAAEHCEKCRGDCCGEQPSAYQAELEKARAERDALGARVAELGKELDRERTKAASAAERVREAKLASSSSARSAATAVGRCGEILEALRAQQPAVFATLMLNTAPNATLRAVAGGYTAQLVARRPWSSVGAIMGDRGGVHGIGPERARAIERWAASLSVL